MHCVAFINAKTIEFLTHFQMPTLLLNYQRPMEKRKATIIESESKDYDALLPYIADDLKADKRLYVCITSAKRANEWTNALIKRFPEKKVKL